MNEDGAKKGLSKPAKVGLLLIPFVVTGAMALGEYAIRVARESSREAEEPQQITRIAPPIADKELAQSMEHADGSPDRANKVQSVEIATVTNAAWFYFSEHFNTMARRLRLVNTTPRATHFVIFATPPDADAARLQFFELERRRPGSVTKFAPP